MVLKDELVVASDPNEEGSPAAAEPAASEKEDVTADTLDMEDVIVEATTETAVEEPTEPAAVAEEASSVTDSDEEEHSAAAEEEGDSSEAAEVEEEEEEEEELVDPFSTLKESCAEKAEAVKMMEVLTECNERVAGKTNTEENCAQELYDFIHVVDHCVSHSLFSKLK